ncbi:Sensory transduction protein regX3 [Pontiella desulfatans]|uniref:Sensory transduction protein regX3 n=1 Tax=Pontiella desulfatans TaxID=2750659 RepID=A0A6C2U2T0_PONDE|nr:response regulator transcription factor [Pontiella desulfatans]VGO14308.1 Sensory transduction protein regX3 [Pontiella desulfatans]
MKSILIAEDDENIRTGLVDLFESEGYRVQAAPDGNAALDCHAAGTFDLVLLDVMMPGKSGYDVCREIRKTDAATPIIMLTAKGEEIDKVVGLQLGADDYVTKPFGVHELIARTEAVLRRTMRPVDDRNDLPAEFLFGDARINAKQYTAEVGGQVHPLTSREMELLRCFHGRAGEVLSRNQLLDMVWGVDYFGTTRTLDQHISQLRKKVEADPSSPTTIVTVHGVGYQYRESSK